MKVSVKSHITIAFCFTILVLFPRFNFVDSEQPKRRDKVAGALGPGPSIEFREPEDEDPQGTRRDSLEHFRAKQYKFRKERVRSDQTSLTDEKVALLEKELVKNLSREVIDLVIMEFELIYFNSAVIFLTSFWQDLRSNFDRREFAVGLVNFWNGEESEEICDQLVSFHYKKNKDSLMLQLYPGYVTHEKSVKELTLDFSIHVDKISCLDVKKSLAVIILIFQKSLNYVYSAYLLFLLSCAFNELYGTEFKESIHKILHNENRVGDRLVSIANDNVAILLKKMRKVSGIHAASPKIRVEPILYPISMKNIDIQAFGLRLCLSLLELSIQRDMEVEPNSMILLFGSRMSTPEEVILATDIFKVLSSKSRTMSEIAALFIYNQDSFTTLISRISLFHNIDISQLKSNIQECVAKIDLYEELNGIRFRTDYQLQAFGRKKT
ncbi:putative secreted protein [Cryptosporidium canis]|uniref:Secreted protein n=1 Tax=Cryptosporidium canis TaxID=195482 RepID=A0ABQ8P4S5_9CRYT|nr:putative secreted protein [Cryptosporidium canis]